MAFDDNIIIGLIIGIVAYIAVYIGKGIQKYALALADVHPGYGSPIGGVGAFDLETGYITFGIVGFDINCGVRTLKTPLKKGDVEKVKEELSEM